MNAIEEIKKGIKALFQPDEVVEIRAFDKFGIRRVGRYPVGWDLVNALAREDVQGRDCYIVLNATSLAPLSIGVDQRGTREADVPRRRHFLLDFDPIRDHKIATDKQHESAKERAREARYFLTAEGWDGIIAASSGNGVHLLVPIDLPNNDVAKQLVMTVQRAIADRFNTREVEVECFPDANRLVRAYGTLNKKGDEDASLKWRRSGVVECL